MDSRREFLKRASLLSGAGLMQNLPASIQKALAINPAESSTYLDAEHVIFLMQENRSFDHTFGTLQGVRGYNDPRAIQLPNKNKVWLQSDKNGNTYAPFRLNIKDTNATWMSSLPHSWTNQVDARNNGNYDKWLDIKHSGYSQYAPMPLTLGHYTREDIPFYYALADAFTVCDHNFCSSLTGTTPNRLFFWTGTIRDKQEAAAQANVWNENAEPGNYVNWKTYPERLEENNISWKMYQNEITHYIGFEGEEESWLSNFGDNAIEYFSQYNAKLSTAYIANLPKAAKKLRKKIEELDIQIANAKENQATVDSLKKEQETLKSYLKINEEDQKYYTKERFEQLSQFEKSIHTKAFSNNEGDPHYNKLTTLKYNNENGEARTVNIPKGDVLYQFREDVKNGQLPTVSWITAPENFSDHPSSAWYGAWYISEVLDILTQNPDVWKKCIFIITYDENDGYFDHLPPFVAPHPQKPETGKCSDDLDTSVEFVTMEQQSYKNAPQARESAIGLGYRVPMIIASPWSRGGWVNSQVFDHTSSLQFLASFLQAKTGKNIVETNISNWRKAVCGDLTSAFRPYNGENISFPEKVQKENFIKSIYDAKFKGLPSGYKALTNTEIELANNHPEKADFLLKQEKGTRSACSLPYELYVDGNLSSDKSGFKIRFGTGIKFFNNKAAGSAFCVYATNPHKQEAARCRDYALSPNKIISDKWELKQFENEEYQLNVYGPNGFYRKFCGSKADPAISITCGYQAIANKPTGKLIFSIKNNSTNSIDIQLVDESYGQSKKTVRIAARKLQTIIWNAAASHNWYDVSIKVAGNTIFEKQYAGKIETNKPTITDPAMA